MLTVILQKTRAPKVLLSAIILMLLLAALLNLTSVAFAQENQLLFHLEDFKDPGSLAVKLQDSRASLAKFLTSQLSAKTQQLLTAYDGTSLPPSALQKELLADLNRLIQEGSLYEDQHFASIPLSEQTQKLLAQTQQSDEDLIRLNRFLLADAYPYEIALPLEKQTPDDSKGIETCRGNLRQIKLALEKYRAKAGTEPQWLSELSPEHLGEKVLLCPADATQGKPGVLTEGAEDPTLPCSYLYEFRPEQKGNQEILSGIVGNMLPIVRCQHHLLNLSISGKFYRNGPQGDIYNSVSNVKITGEPQQKMFHIRSAEDLAAVREQLGDAYFETEDGKALLKRFAKQPVASNPSEAPSIVNKQSVTGEPQQQKTFYIRSQEDLAAVREQLGDAYFETEDGKALLKRFAKQPRTSTKTETQKLIGTVIPDVAFRNLSGEPVKLEQFRGKFVLLNLFSADSISCGPDLQRLEKQLENANAARLKAIGISTGDPVATIEAFKQKHQLSMPIWVGKNDQIQNLVKRDVSKPQTGLITILLNSELVVEAVFTDMESLVKKVTELIEPKE